MAKNLTKNKEKQKTSKSSGVKKWLGSERMKHGAVAKVFTVAFLLVLILCNVLVDVFADRFPSLTRFDLTSSNLNSLSEESLEVVKGIDEPTTIYMIGNEDDIKNDRIYQTYNVKYSQFLNLVQRYAEVNSNISYQIIDPDKNPSFISKYADESLSAGYILVESERRYKALTPSDLFMIQSVPDYTTQTMTYNYFSTADSAIANALYLTNLDHVPVVAVATGHSEILTSVNSSTNTSALSSFYELLKDNNYDVKEFNILTDEIPEDASIVMIPTPTTDYTAEELDKLDAFLATEGTETHSLFVTFYPTQGSLPNLTGFLEEWGIVVGEPGTMVYEAYTTKQYGGASAIFGEYVENEAVRMDTGVYNNLLLPNSVPMGLSDDAHSYTERFVLAQGSATTYASDKEESNPQTENTPIIVMSQKQWTVDNDFYNANVIACGNSEMFTSQLINTSTFSNGDYLIDLFAFASDSSDLSSGLKVNQIQTYAPDVTASDATLRFFGLGIFTIGIPAAVLVIGLVVFLRRRHL